MVVVVVVDDDGDGGGSECGDGGGASQDMIETGNLSTNHNNMHPGRGTDILLTFTRYAYSCFH